MSFSQAIMDVVIPTNFMTPRITFTGTEDPKANITTFHTQMMIFGETDAMHCKLFIGTFVGTTLDWFIGLPDGQYQGEPLKDFLNRFRALVVKLHTKDEAQMVHVFRRGILSGPFSYSLIKNLPKTFNEIHQRAVAHIDQRAGNGKTWERWADKTL